MSSQNTLQIPDVVPLELRMPFPSYFCALIPFTVLNWDHAVLSGHRLAHLSPKDEEALEQYEEITKRRMEEVITWSTCAVCDYCLCDSLSLRFI